MKTIVRIGVKSSGKIMGFTSALFGLLFGAIFSLISLLALGGGGDGGMPIFFGVLAIIFLPIFYGGFGFVMGIVYAWIYNFAAKKVGGIEIELKDAPPSPATTTAQ